MNKHKFKDILDFHHNTLGMEDNKKEAKAKKLGIDYNEYKQRIIGKEKEAEFYIILRSSLVVDNIIVVDEENSKENNEYTPDFIVKFKDDLKDGLKVMIEVKHTTKDKIEISQGNLKKRIDYAKEKNMDLRFAISLKGFWGLFDSNFVMKNNGKINYSHYINNNQCNTRFDRELEFGAYKFEDPIQIKCIFSKDANKKGLGYKHHEFGQLIKFKFYNKDELIFEVNSTDDYKYFHAIILLNTFVNNIASNFILVSFCDSIDSNTTHLILSSHGDNYFYHETDFILNYIASIKHSNINMKDNIYITANKDNTNIFTVDYIRLIMSDLADSNIKLKYKKDNNIDDFDKYRKTYWRKNS